MDKVKLLFLVDQLGGGGAERVVTETAIHLPSNFETLVCLTRREGNFEYTEMLKDHDVPFILLERKWRFDLVGLSKLYRLVHDFKPDIIHTHKFGSRAPLDTSTTQGTAKHKTS